MSPDLPLTPQGKLSVPQCDELTSTPPAGVGLCVCPPTQAGPFFFGGIPCRLPISTPPHPPTLSRRFLPSPIACRYPSRVLFRRCCPPQGAPEGSRCASAPAKWGHRSGPVGARRPCVADAARPGPARTVRSPSPFCFCVSSQLFSSSGQTAAPPPGSVKEKLGQKLSWT